MSTQQPHGPGNEYGPKEAWDIAYQAFAWGLSESVVYHELGWAESQNVGYFWPDLAADTLVVPGVREFIFKEIDEHVIDIINNVEDEDNVNWNDEFEGVVHDGFGYREVEWFPHDQLTREQRDAILAAYHERLSNLRSQG